jgi:hypothetical protein
VLPDWVDTWHQVVSARCCVQELQMFLKAGSLRAHLHMDCLAQADQGLAGVNIHVCKLTELLLCNGLKGISRWRAQPVSCAAVDQ